MNRRLTRIPLITAITALLATAVAVAEPTVAQAVPFAAEGRAEVTSVDGPGLLTIRAGRRSLPVRLSSVDLPKQGECGAAETTVALRGFVSRAPGKLRYQLVGLDKRRLARDPDGRYLATVSYRYGLRELGGDLIAADWGRPGEPVAVGARDPDPEVLASAIDLPGRDLPDAPRPRRGIWARCGGLVHLPLGQAAPQTAPAPWTIDEHGITTAVGPIAPPASLTPGNALTFRQLVGVAATEITRWYDGCRAWLPSLQIRVWGYGSGARCEDGYVSSIRTAGPDPAPITRGGAVGDPGSGLLPRFPLLAPDETSSTWTLSGPNRPQWAWQTDALIDTDQRVSGLATFASPLLPTR